LNVKDSREGYDFSTHSTGARTMEFQIRRADGTLEWRRHIPYDILPDGQRWKAVHKGNGRLLGRFDAPQTAQRNMDTCTEPVPHYKPKA
jgi:hypothetical protein